MTRIKLEPFGWLDVEWYGHRGWPASLEEEGCEDTLEIEGIALNDCDITHMLSDHAIREIEIELRAHLRAMAQEPRE